MGYTQKGILKSISAASTDALGFWYEWLAKDFKALIEAADFNIPPWVKPTPQYDIARYFLRLVC